MASRQEVVDFLTLFKSGLTLGYFNIRHRQKNIQSLIDLEISANERTEILLGLIPADYVTGPKPDDTDSDQDIWVFGKNVEEKEVYIKLQLTQDTRNKRIFRASVWSFHPADYPMRYPLRGGEK